MKMPLGSTLCMVLAVAATVAVQADLNVGADRSGGADLKAAADRKVSTTIASVDTVLAPVRSAGLQAGGHEGLQAGQSGSGPSAAVLSKYCITCHNEKRKTAGLAIDTLDVQRVGPDAEVWERIARKFRTHEMPPPGAPRPDGATYAAVTAHLEHALDSAASTNPNPVACLFIG